jgi:hypothetical protein
MARISKSELIKLQKTLKTDGAIGEKFGVTRQAVHHLRKVYGIDSNRARNDERDKKILAMYKSGKTGRVISEKVGLAVAQTYRIIARMNKGKKPARKK